MMQQVMKHRGEFLADLRGGDYELTDAGVLFPKKSEMVIGHYWHRVNGGDWVIDKNLIVDQGIIYILGVAFGATTKITTWYLALYATGVTPATTWTAANFTANSGEITSTTEGYSESVRQTWTSAAPLANAISNLASLATFTIATASSITVNGAGLLSSNTRGGTSGTLASAGRYASARTLFNADLYQIGYQMTLAGT